MNLEDLLVKAEHDLAVNSNNAPLHLHHANLLGMLQRHAEASEAAKRAANLDPDLDQALALAGHMARLAGKNDDALALLQNAAISHPDSAIIAGALGCSIAAKGDRRTALIHLRRGVNKLGVQLGCLWEYTTALALEGLYHELILSLPLIDAHTMPGQDMRGPIRHIALARLSLARDRSEDVIRATALEASSRWLDTQNLHKRIAHAIEQNTPFSFIRVNDGEARFVAYFDSEVRNLLPRRELIAMMDSIWPNWFGRGSIENWDENEVAALTPDLTRALKGADVIGIPSSTVLIEDSYHYGFYSVMIEAVHKLKPNAAFTYASGNHALHGVDPGLRRLLEGLPFVGYVGCHPGLAERLKALYHIDETRAFLVAGELGASKLPEELRSQGHYPKHYQWLLTELSVPFTGAVFLVAAGFLGKMYCTRIKELGGIAIDIGSLVDGWLGYV